MLDDYSDLAKKATNQASGALGSLSSLGGLAGSAEAAAKAGEASLSPFVTGLWAKGADVKLAAIDVYEDVKADVLSNVPAIQSSLDSLKGKLSSVKGMVKNVQNAIKIAKDLKSALNSGDVLDRVINSTGVLGSTLAKYGIDAPTIAKYIDSTRGLAVSVKSGINDAKSTYDKIKAINFHNYMEACNIIGEMTGIDGLHEIADLSTEIATNTVVFKKYMEAGGDDAETYNALVGNMSDPTVQVQVVSNLLPTVISQSKLYTLREMNKSMGASILTGLQPDIIRNFASNFVAPEFNNFEEGKQYYSDLITTFYEIDPNWNKAIWGKIGNEQSVQIVNIASIIGASVDFKELVNSYALIVGRNGSTVVPLEDKLGLLSKLLVPTTVKASMATQFPSVSYKEVSVVRS